ncbi:MAG: dethiobiotin synthase [Porticoccaceae bacterium]|nr:dethiobiotin synthase [Porticoccaceae bacterium]
MRGAYFVTGTDTDVGKTLIATGLLLKAREQGLSTAAIKPVAAGAELTPGGLRNADALALSGVCYPPMAYDEINPVCLAPPIAPHIAAGEAGRELSVPLLAGHCQPIIARNPGLLLVEGAGGWRVPLNDRETLADLAIALKLPVIIVVAMRLGCISHALLTVEAVARDGLPLAGWVANQVGGTMSRYDENLAYLREHIRAPLLGEVPWLADADPGRLTAYLNLPDLS